MKVTKGVKGWAWRGLLGLCLLPFHVAVQAADLDSVLRLEEKGRYQEALQQLDGYIKEHPYDVQARFQKGVLLIHLKRRDEAIAFYEAMIKDFPELPEPYNNLAVLHAEAREFDKAEDALKRAIHTHPSYATAHENLGDIFARKASFAYNQALQLDQSNTAAQAKLALVTKLITLPVSAKSEPVVVAAAPAPPTPPAPPAAKPEPAAPPVLVAAAPPVKPAPAVAAPPPPAPLPKEEPVLQAKPAPGEELAPVPARDVKPVPEAHPEETEILTVIKEWASAWSRKDANGYLAAYHSGFKPPAGQPRAAWEGERKTKIAAPKFIKVNFRDPSLRFQSNGEVWVFFLQDYASDRVKDTIRKILVMKQDGQQWKILQEMKDG